MRSEGASVEDRVARGGERRERDGHRVLDTSADQQTLWVGRYTTARQPLGAGFAVLLEPGRRVAGEERSAARIGRQLGEDRTRVEQLGPSDGQVEVKVDTPLFVARQRHDRRRGRRPIPDERAPPDLAIDEPPACGLGVPARDRHDVHAQRPRQLPVCGQPLARRQFTVGDVAGEGIRDREVQRSVIAESGWCPHGSSSVTLRPLSACDCIDNAPSA